jgi:hypothetical protein
MILNRRVAGRSLAGLLACATALLMFAVITPSGVVAGENTPPVVTRSYAASDAVITNPERGFYHHTETHYREDGSGYQPLDAATSRGFREEGISQILRVFYLEKFAERDVIDAEYLSLVQADFDAARSAGVSVIVRFAYVQGTTWPLPTPYGDAPVDRVLKHIAQLGPVLKKNSDVIATIQSGFVGVWGEGYYTDYFSDPDAPSRVSEQNWADRAAVIRALLDSAPDLTVQVRTMLMKQKTFGTSSGAQGAMKPNQAYDGSDLSRVGHHNDCFLAAPDDWGTFLTDPLSLDQEYLERDSRYVPVGGETCNVNPPRSEWPTASAEMARYHYSYLNADYHRTVLASWGENVETATKLLGYRFVLRKASFGTPAASHRSFPVHLSIENSGWAAPYNPRRVQLVLESRTAVYVFTFDADPRTWEPGTTTDVQATVCTATLPAGDYRLYVALPSAHERLAKNPHYAVQLANEGTWNAERGWNDLQHRVHVPTLAGSADCAPGTVRPMPLG